MISLFMLRLRKLLLSMRHPISRRSLFSFRVLGAFEHKHVLQLADFSTIVDIGANRGQFSLAARCLNPKAQIFAFEPLEAPSAVYLDVMRGDSLTALHRVAIADKNGQETMHVSKKNDSSSILPIGERQVALFPESVEVERCTVTTTRLSDVLSGKEFSGKALLKIDVQGFELDVLKGCHELLPLFCFVYVECSFVELYETQAVASEVIAYLSNQAFSLQGVYNLYTSDAGEPIQADFLFRSSGVF
jgi:FkbM family methyltransferase